MRHSPDTNHPLSLKRARRQFLTSFHPHCQVLLTCRRFVDRKMSPSIGTRSSSRCLRSFSHLQMSAIRNGKRDFSDANRPEDGGVGRATTRQTTNATLVLVRNTATERHGLVSRWPNGGSEATCRILTMRMRRRWLCDFLSHLNWRLVSMPFPPRLDPLTNPQASMMFCTLTTFPAAGRRPEGSYLQNCPQNQRSTSCKCKPKLDSGLLKKC